MTIQILPPAVADQIAAGEVVERPASAIKELVENALDAGATEIVIELNQGGKSLMRVQDNGSGMTPQEARLAPQRHATSKIAKIEDIFALHTFGFRGEALAALSAVADFTLQTRDAQSSTGTEIRFNNGQFSAENLVPLNTGTTITVENLFAPVPARQQYLKTDLTEYRACLRVLQAAALGRFDVGFRVFHNSELKAHWRATQDLGTRLKQIFPSEGWLELPLMQSQNASLSGWIMAPDQVPTHRQHQWWLINDRPVNDRSLSFAVEQAYTQGSGLLKPHYPAFLLQLKLDPILVDINVHPRKLEVKLAEPQEAFALVKQAVGARLADWSRLPINSLATDSGAGISLGIEPAKGSPLASKNFGSHPFFPPKAHAAFRSSSAAMGSSAVPQFSAENSLPPEISELTLLGQVAHRYLAASSADGFFLFDQHALHERLLFAELSQKWQEKQLTPQVLLIPQMVELDLVLVSFLVEQKSALQDLGFEFELLEDTKLNFLAVPAGLEKIDLLAWCQDFGRHFSAEKIGELPTERLARRCLEYASCRAAVKFGDPLTPEEGQALLDQFLALPEWRNLCPHGRPNHQFWTWDTLDKNFGRL